MMMMEAMRLSLLEHEEQQRRQAQAQSRQDSQGNVPATAPIRNDSQEVDVHSSVNAATTSQAQSAPAGTTSLSSIQQQQPTQPRTSSLAQETAPSFVPTARYSLTHQELGISSAMMAELSELVDGGSSSSSSDSNSPTSAIATPAVPQSFSQAPALGASTSFLPGSPVAPTTPPVGSPSRIGTNPNNPFRRMGGSATNSPSHSRQGSTLQTSFTGANSPPGPGSR